MKNMRELDDNAKRIVRRNNIEHKFGSFIQNYYNFKNPALFDYADEGEGFDIKWFIAEVKGEARDRLRRMAEKQFNNYKYIEHEAYTDAQKYGIITGILNGQFLLSAGTEDELSAFETIDKKIVDGLADVGITERFVVDVNAHEFINKDVKHFDKTLPLYEYIAKLVGNSAASVNYAIMTYVNRECIHKKIEEENQRDIKGIFIEYLIELDEIRNAA